MMFFLSKSVLLLLLLTNDLILGIAGNQVIDQIKQKIFIRALVSRESFNYNNVRVGSTKYYLKTKVECAGQCLLTSSCSAFSFIGTSCETFNAEYLYRNKNDYNPQEVYIEDSLWNIHVNVSWSGMSEWTEWTYVCDSGERYRYRQCEGSNPLAYTGDGNGIVTPQTTPQYGGERDCASEYINGQYISTKQTETRTQPYCNRPVVTVTGGANCPQATDATRTSSTLHEVEIKSPNYPNGHYLKDMNCEWVVSFPTTLNRYKRLQADVEYQNDAFWTERTHDVLKIQNEEYHGTYGNENCCNKNTHDMTASRTCYTTCNIHGYYQCCGASTYTNNYVNPNTATSYDGETIRITFESDSSTQGKGFFVKVRLYTSYSSYSCPAYLSFFNPNTNLCQNQP